MDGSSLYRISEVRAEVTDPPNKSYLDAIVAPLFALVVVVCLELSDLFVVQRGLQGIQKYVLLFYCMHYKHTRSKVVIPSALLLGNDEDHCLCGPNFIHNEGILETVGETANIKWTRLCVITR
ncbi:hypothetical protein J6590_091388 [Homalodisca vitripennis]|nr:hypothetical protein J6590_091388 [Homalodisca vitripennis]